MPHRGWERNISLLGALLSVCLCLPFPLGPFLPWVCTCAEASGMAPGALREEGAERFKGAERNPQPQLPVPIQGQRGRSAEEG